MDLKHPIIQAGFAWASASEPPEISKDDYCPTRDILDARLASIISTLTRKGKLEEQVLLMHALLSEIGGNSFDHNIGQWRDLTGVLFGRSFDEAPIFVLADRGQGIRKTLSQVKPTLGSHEEALKAAFLEHISGRAPEQRGNGLKFVREEILNDGIDLFFQSGTAMYQVVGKKEQWGSLARNVPGCLAVLSFTKA